MELNDYLRKMVEAKGSDIYLSTDAPPSMKVHGKLETIEDTPLPPGRVQEIAESIMNEKQCIEFAEMLEMNLALAIDGIGRFRVNIFKQRSQTSMVIRHIETIIPLFDDLGMPLVVKELIMRKRGLILFVGGTGSGKSTSLAALINHRNTNSSGHIITIEDPVEYIHSHKNCIINQREVGLDTHTFDDALKNTLRQAPDVILVGEIRSQDTMEHAIAFSETGHLCLSTLHANNANQALDRIINFFPEARHRQLLMDLSLNVVAIISQRLIPTIDGKRALAAEILINTPRVADLIKNGQINEIKEAMEKSENLGMLTFDSALFNLYEAGIISLEEALKNADSENNLRLRISLKENKHEHADSGLSLAEDVELDKNKPDNETITIKKPKDIEF